MWFQSVRIWSTHNCDSRNIQMDRVCYYSHLNSRVWREYDVLGTTPGNQRWCASLSRFVNCFHKHNIDKFVAKKNIPPPKSPTRSLFFILAMIAVKFMIKYWNYFVQPSLRWRMALELMLFRWPTSTNKTLWKERAQKSRQRSTLRIWLRILCCVWCIFFNQRIRCRFRRRLSAIWGQRSGTSFIWFDFSAQFRLFTRNLIAS